MKDKIKELYKENSFLGHVALCTVHEDGLKNVQLNTEVHVQFEEYTDIDCTDVFGEAVFENAVTLSHRMMGIDGYVEQMINTLDRLCVADITVAKKNAMELKEFDAMVFQVV